MEKADKPLKIIDKSHLCQDEFTNNQLTPSVVTNFNCCNCNQNNQIKIVPYKTGFPFSSLYLNNFLSKEDILDFKIATVSSKWSLHLGVYLVKNLPTLYFIEKCTHCSKNFLIVFGLGESQLGKLVCKISGVWLLKDM